VKFKSTKDVSSSRFVALIVGPSGIGKTSQVRYLPEGKTLILSAEAGLLCLQGTDYAVAEIKTTEELMNVFSYLNNGADFQYIFIDSLTEILEIVLTELKEDPRYSDPKMTLKMYGTYNEQATKIIKAFRDLSSYSVIFTCLDENAKNGVEVVKEFNIPGSSIKNSLMAWFDLVLHLHAFTDEEGKVHRKFITDSTISPLAKDRSGKLESYEDADLSAIINKVLGGTNEL
jgi:phage nucleotide-binding protein